MSMLFTMQNDTVTVEPDIDAWLRWRAYASPIVERTSVGGGQTVETTFLGYERRVGAGLFVVSVEGGPISGYQTEHSTLSEAQAEHERLREHLSIFA
jgi:hypothetical protein